MPALYIGSDLISGAKQEIFVDTSDDVPADTSALPAGTKVNVVNEYGYYILNSEGQWVPHGNVKGVTQA